MSAHALNKILYSVYDLLKEAVGNKMGFSAQISSYVNDLFPQLLEIEMIAIELLTKINKDYDEISQEKEYYEQLIQFQADNSNNKDILVAFQSLIDKQGEPFSQEEQMTVYLRELQVCGTLLTVLLQYLKQLKSPVLLFQRLLYINIAFNTNVNNLGEFFTTFLQFGNGGSNIGPVLDDNLGQNKIDTKIDTKMDENLFKNSNNFSSHSHKQSHHIFPSNGGTNPPVVALSDVLTPIGTDNHHGLGGFFQTDNNLSEINSIVNSYTTMNTLLDQTSPKPTQSTNLSMLPVMSLDNHIMMYNKDDKNEKNEKNGLNNSNSQKILTKSELKYFEHCAELISFLGFILVRSYDDKLVYIDDNGEKQLLSIDFAFDSEFHYHQEQELVEKNEEQKNDPKNNQNNSTNNNTKPELVSTIDQLSNLFKLTTGISQPNPAPIVQNVPENTKKKPSPSPPHLSHPQTTLPDISPHIPSSLSTNAIDPTLISLHSDDTLSELDIPLPIKAQSVKSAQLLGPVKNIDAIGAGNSNGSGDINEIGVDKDEEGGKGGENSFVNLIRDHLLGLDGVFEAIDYICYEHYLNEPSVLSYFKVVNQVKKYEEGLKEKGEKNENVEKKEEKTLKKEKYWEENEIERNKREVVTNPEVLASRKRLTSLFEKQQELDAKKEQFLRYRDAKLASSKAKNAQTLANFGKNGENYQNHQNSSNSNPEITHFLNRNKKSDQKNDQKSDMIDSDDDYDPEEALDVINEEKILQDEFNALLRDITKEDLKSIEKSILLHLGDFGDGNNSHLGGGNGGGNGGGIGSGSIFGKNGEIVIRGQDNGDNCDDKAIWSSRIDGLMEHDTAVGFDDLIDKFNFLEEKNQLDSDAMSVVGDENDEINASEYYKKIRKEISESQWGDDKGNGKNGGLNYKKNVLNLNDDLSENSSQYTWTNTYTYAYTDATTIPFPIKPQDGGDLNVDGFEINSIFTNYSDDDDTTQKHSEKTLEIMKKKVELYPQQVTYNNQRFLNKIKQIEAKFEFKSDNKNNDNDNDKKDEKIEPKSLKISLFDQSDDENCDEQNNSKNDKIDLTHGKTLGNDHISQDALFPLHSEDNNQIGYSFLDDDKNSDENSPKKRQGNLESILLLFGVLRRSIFHCHQYGLAPYHNGNVGGYDQDQGGDYDEDDEDNNDEKNNENFTVRSISTECLQEYEYNMEVALETRHLRSAYNKQAPTNPETIEYNSLQQQNQNLNQENSDPKNKNPHRKRPQKGSTQNNYSNPLNPHGGDEVTPLRVSEMLREVICVELIDNFELDSFRIHELRGLLYQAFTELKRISTNHLLGLKKQKEESDEKIKIQQIVNTYSSISQPKHTFHMSPSRNPHSIQLNSIVGVGNNDGEGIGGENSLVGSVPVVSNNKSANIMNNSHRQSQPIDLVDDNSELFLSVIPQDDNFNNFNNFNNFDQNNPHHVSSELKFGRQNPHKNPQNPHYSPHLLQTTLSHITPPVNNYHNTLSRHPSDYRILDSISSVGTRELIHNDDDEDDDDDIDRRSEHNNSVSSINLTYNHANVNVDLGVPRLLVNNAAALTVVPGMGNGKGGGKKGAVGGFGEEKLEKKGEQVNQQNKRNIGQNNTQNIASLSPLVDFSGFDQLLQLTESFLPGDADQGDEIECEISQNPAIEGSGKQIEQIEKIENKNFYGVFDDNFDPNHSAQLSDMSINTAERVNDNALSMTIPRENNIIKFGSTITVMDFGGDKKLHKNNNKNNNIKKNKKISLDDIELDDDDDDNDDDDEGIDNNNINDDEYYNDEYYNDDIDNFDNKNFQNNIKKNENNTIKKIGKNNEKNISENNTNFASHSLLNLPINPNHQQLHQQHQLLSNSVSKPHDGIKNVQNIQNNERQNSNNNNNNNNDQNNKPAPTALSSYNYHQTRRVTETSFSIAPSMNESLDVDSVLSLGDEERSQRSDIFIINKNNNNNNNNNNFIHQQSHQQQQHSQPTITVSGNVDSDTNQHHNNPQKSNNINTNDQNNNNDNDNNNNNHNNLNTTNISQSLFHTEHYLHLLTTETANTLQSIKNTINFIGELLEVQLEDQIQKENINTLRELDDIDRKDEENRAHREQQMLKKRGGKRDKRFTLKMVRRRKKRGQ